MNFIDKIFLKVLGYFDDLAEKINDVVTFDVGQELKKKKKKKKRK